MAFGGSARFALRFRLQRRGRTYTEFIRSDDPWDVSWSRKLASEALDMLQYVYGVTRKNVRFIHH